MAKKKAAKAAPEVVEETTSVEITATQNRIVVNALYDYLIETRSYMRGSKVPKEPTAEDSCCPAHLARYEERKSSYNALKGRSDEIIATLKRFGEKDPEGAL